jgi:hypothetical protein
MQDQHTEASTAEPVEAVSSPKTAPACLQIDPNGITLFIEFTPDRQFVRVDYDKTKIKTWDMAIGILHMALVQAQTAREMAIGQNIQRQQHEAMQRQQQEFETQMMAQRLANEPQNKKIHVGR